MKHGLTAWMMILASSLAWAQAPVEERAVRTPPDLQHQQRAEYARGEREKAAASVEQATRELDEAKRAQYAAEKQLHVAKQRTLKAQQSLDHAQAALHQATDAEQRMQREVK